MVSGVPDYEIERDPYSLSGDRYIMRERSYGGYAPQGEDTMLATTAAMLLFAGVPWAIVSLLVIHVERSAYWSKIGAVAGIWVATAFLVAAVFHRRHYRAVLWGGVVGAAAQLVAFVREISAHNMMPHFFHELSDKVWSAPTRPITQAPWTVILVLPTLSVGIMLIVALFSPKR